MGHRNSTWWVKKRKTDNTGTRELYLGGFERERGEYYQDIFYEILKELIKSEDKREIKYKP